MIPVRARQFARTVSAALAAFALIALASSCGSHAISYIVVQNPTPAPDAVQPVRVAAEGDSIVNARFQNVSFHMWPGVVLDLSDLTGRMHSTRHDHVVSFDDKMSFVLAIDSGTVGLGMDDLAHLMNTYVFAYQGAPLRGLSFETDGNHLVQRGILHKVVDIPFEMVAEVSATKTSEIRVHPISMKICSINGEGLMKALGVTLEKLIDVRQAKGVRVEGNDLLLDPIKLLPPPAISGRLSGVKVEPGRLVQYFAATSNRLSRSLVEPDTTPPNYMYFRGGTLKFGKLFMVHADMQVIDLSPADPFDFDIGHYHEQLVAGFHRTTPADGLLVFMPDLSKMNAAMRATAATAAPDR